MMRVFPALFLSLCVLASSCAGPQEDFVPQRPEDLVGHSVAVTANSSIDLDLSKYEGVELLRIGIGELTVAVRSGRAEFAMIQEIQFDANRLKDLGFRKCFSGYLKGNAAVAVRHEDTLLCRRFNEFLGEFIASGERDRWLRDWSSNPDSMAVAQRSIPVNTEGETIVTGVALVYPFIFMKDEQLAGLEIDMMERFCRWGGYRAEYLITDLPGLIPSLNTGKADALVSHIQVTEERSKQVLFTIPYFEGSICCFGRDPEAAGARKGLVQTVRDSIYANLIMEQHWKLLLQGLLVTLEISLLSILCSILLGAGFCFLRMRRSRALSATVKLLTETIQGIPVLVILMMMCYVVFAKSHISGTLVAIFSFALFYGARFCGLFRSGMLSVGRGQWEAGAALGLSKFQTFRLVALPQAFRRIIPVFKGEIVSLIKSTSIVGYVAVIDLTYASNMVRARTFDAFFPLILVSIIYILLSRLSARALNAMERRVNSKK